MDVEENWIWLKVGFDLQTIEFILEMIVFDLQKIEYSYVP